MHTSQNYMPPGAAQTVETIADTFQLRHLARGGSGGEGTGAATLAGQYPCRKVRIELRGTFVHENESMRPLR
jgi:hypothetical protein